VLTARSRSSAWDQISSAEEFAEELRRVVPYAPVGDAVFALRAKRGLTQRQLASLAGTTQSVIARLESGEHEIRVGILNRIAEALSLTWRVVFDDQAAATNVIAASTTFVRTSLVVRTAPSLRHVGAQAAQEQEWAATEPPRLAMAS
jgi:transcriptional regulator with XRE-family HTH domain